MVREISGPVRAQVLWDAGHMTPKSMMRRGNIPERSAERYIQKLKRGEKKTKKQKNKNFLRKNKNCAQGDQESLYKRQISLP